MSEEDERKKREDKEAWAGIVVAGFLFLLMVLPQNGVTLIHKWYWQHHAYIDLDVVSAFFEREFGGDLFYKLIHQLIAMIAPLWNDTMNHEIAQYGFAGLVSLLIGKAVEKAFK